MLINKIGNISLYCQHFPSFYCNVFFLLIMQFYWRTHEFLSFEKRRKRSLQTFRYFNGLDDQRNIVVT